MIRYIPVILVFLTVVSGPDAGARQSAGERQQRLEALQSQEQDQPYAIPQSPGSAFESTVNPELYYVGPSDILGVNIWSGQPVNFNLTVTPEGSLIVPTVGEIRVSGKTLADVKTEVSAQVRKRYASFPVTVSLLKPRQVVVSVVGKVIHPGLYTLAATDRADRAIDLADRQDPLNDDPQQVQRIRQETSRRSIVLQHRDGTSDKVDITKYLASRDEALNPFLREGDVVVVPGRDPDKNVVAIYGEVNVPGSYEFVEGDRLDDILKIAHGFTPRAMTDSVEFSRLSSDGRSMTSRIINLSNGVPDDPPLQAGDRVVVRAHPDLRENYRVTVDGEVRFPGIYPITKDRTTILEIVSLAGGVTGFAALGNATLNRRSAGWGDLELERLMSLRGVYSAEDSADYLNETNLRLQQEIVSVDFKRLILERDSSQNVVLRDGDRITVPSIRNTIYVFGQIVRPGHVPFVRGSGVDYYIETTGGYTDRARVDDVRIIKASTRQWLTPDDTQIEEGDQIWVPKEPDRSFAYYVNIASQSAAVLSVVIGIAVLIVQVTK